MCCIALLCCLYAWPCLLLSFFLLHLSLTCICTYTFIDYIYKLTHTRTHTRTHTHAHTHTHTYVHTRTHTHTHIRAHTHTHTHTHTCTHAHTHTHTHAHSHYFVYVVKSNEVPDTSTIQGSGFPSAYITAAYVDVDRVFQASIVIGNNAVTSYNGINYTNVPVDRGTTYFFFIRLYSGVVSNLHIFMGDEKEERKTQARSNKQTRQSNTAHPRQSLS